MSESWALPELPRGTLLAPEARLARLHEGLPLIEAVVEGETDAVALESTVACLLWHTLVHANWCGFYRRVDERTLAVGPYQGSLGCLRIDFDRGVCGAAARTGEVQRVPDVDAFPGHIACDSASRSELVVPVCDAHGRVRAVLDIDSPHLDAFTEAEADVLREFVDRVFTARDARGPLVW